MEVPWFGVEGRVEGRCYRRRTLAISLTYDGAVSFCVEEEGGRGG